MNFVTRWLLATFWLEVRLLAWDARDSLGCIYNLISFIGTRHGHRRWLWRAERSPDFRLKRTENFALFFYFVLFVRVLILCATVLILFFHWCFVFVRWVGSGLTVTGRGEVVLVFFSKLRLVRWVNYLVVKGSSVIAVNCGLFCYFHRRRCPFFIPPFFFADTIVRFFYSVDFFAVAVRQVVFLSAAAACRVIILFRFIGHPHKGYRCGFLFLAAVVFFYSADFSPMFSILLFRVFFRLLFHRRR